jgi:hypothetical protein
MSPCNRGTLITSDDGSIAITSISGGFDLSAIGGGGGGTPTACSLGALAVTSATLTVVVGLDASNCIKKVTAGTNGQFLKQGATTFTWATITSTDVGLNNVTNVAQLPLSYLDTDGTLAADSDVKVASQKATKTYAIPKTLLTTKGDIIAATGASTPARLGVGTNGYALVADSAEATGVKWASVTGSGAVATDGIWDAKGDLAGGTGANTASKLSVGTNGHVLTADSAEATGLKWAAPGGVSDGDKGDVTVSASGATWTIDNDAVTYAKIQNVSATDRLLGRDTAAAGDVEELTVSGGIEFTGTGGIQTSAFTGDVTKSASGTVLTIANDAVTYAKMQNVSATDKLLGRSTAGSGDVEEITCTAAARTILDDVSTAAMLTTLGGQPLDATLTSLAAYNTNGILVQTSADTFAGRTIDGTADHITVTNGSGVSGNPTLSLPVSIKIVTAILDTNGNETIKFTATGSAVNEITVTNAATAGNPKISATGGDTNVSLLLDAKGTGVIRAQQAVIPDPVALSDAANIATDASLGNHFRVTLGGNRTLDNPTNPTDGQKCTWEIIQDGTGSRTLAYGSQFTFGTDVTSPTLTTTASKRDFIGAVYNGTTTKWYVLGVVRGY